METIHVVLGEDLLQRADRAGYERHPDCGADALGFALGCGG